jgi:Domain of unknown function DUF11
VRTRRLGGLILAASLAVLVAPTSAFAASNVDLSVTHSPDPFIVGEDGTITIDATYLADDPEGFVTISDTLPDTLTYVSLTSSAAYNCTVTGQTVDCDNGTIAAGDTTIVITVDPTAIGDPVDEADYCHVEIQPGIRHGSSGPRQAKPNAQACADTADASDTIPVVAPSPTPTPTATATPTPTHTARPTPTPTHHTTTATPAPSVIATSAAAAPTLPMTGGNDLPQLVAVAAAMLALGARLVVGARRTPARQPYRRLH